MTQTGYAPEIEKTISDANRGLAKRIEALETQLKAERQVADKAREQRRQMLLLVEAYRKKHDALWQEQKTYMDVGDKCPCELCQQNP